MFGIGGFLASIELLTGIGAEKIAIPINLILSSLALLGYIKSRSVKIRVILAFLFTFFFNGLLIFSLDNLLDNETDYPYYLIWLIDSVLVGASLLLADLLRFQLAQTRSTDIKDE